MKKNMEADIGDLRKTARHAKVWISVREIRAIVEGAMQ